MPLEATTYPQTWNTLHSGGKTPVYVIFYSNVEGGKMWCPDCRNVESHISSYFSPPTSPRALIHWVGSRSEWRDSKNEARVKWGVNSVPTVVRMSEGKETDRLEMYDIVDSAKWKKFVS